MYHLYRRNGDGSESKRLDTVDYGTEEAATRAAIVSFQREQCHTAGQSYLIVRVADVCELLPSDENREWRRIRSNSLPFRYFIGAN